jgi:hypothetical protein
MSSVRSRVVLAVFALCLSFTAVADPRADVVAAFEAMLAKGGYSAVVEGTAGGKPTRTELRVLWPDRYHIKSDNAGTKTEMIILPGASYMNNGGNWMKLPMDMSAMSRAYSPEIMRKGLEGMSNVVDLGSEDLDGIDARVYAYDSKVTVMNITSTSKVKVWVDADTGLIVRHDSDGQAAGMHSKTVARYNYDKVEIKAPL